jgi:hypothetical protein
MSRKQLLTTRQMAHFAASGFIRFDALVPEELNQAFLSEIGHSEPDALRSPKDHYARIMASSAIPVVPAGTPLADAYPAESTLGRILALPELAGAISSLVGERCTFDHHFLHITFPPELTGRPLPAQHTHQDSTIDPRQAFDIQILYFPHEVTAEMGGTRGIRPSPVRLTWYARQAPCSFRTKGSGTVEAPTDHTGCATCSRSG